MSCELVQVGIYERREGRDVVSKVESCGHRSVVHIFMQERCHGVKIAQKIKWLRELLKYLLAFRVIQN